MTQPRIFKSLLEAYDNGSNIKARSQMAIASFEAGIAFNNSSVTLVHGMSRPIGAIFHVPHGAANAMLLVKSLEFIRPKAVSRLNDLAAAIGIIKPEMTMEDGAKAFVEETKKLLGKLSVREIKDYNIDREEFYGCMGKMAEDALASGSPGNTRKDVKKEDIIEIYKLLWEEPKYIQGGTKYEQ